MEEGEGRGSGRRCVRSVDSVTDYIRGRKRVPGDGDFSLGNR